MFRAVEEKTAKEQEMVRAVAKQRASPPNERQTGLFDQLPVVPGPRSFDDEQRVRLQQGKDRLMQTLRSERCIG